MSEGIDVNIADGLCECINCHYRYFLQINLKFQPEVCNGSHDLTQKAIIFNDVAVVFVKGNDLKFIFCYMSKDEALSLLKKLI